MAPDWLVALCRPPVGDPAVPSAVELNADRLGPYVRAALHRECEAVAVTLPGSRNDRLNRGAFALGSLVGAGVLGEELVVVELGAPAARAGLESPESSGTIASGLAAGRSQPRALQARALSG